MYIQKLIDRERFDVPKEFRGLFIENFDLSCDNFINSVYNDLYKDIRTLFEFDDEGIIGEIYDGQKIEAAMSMLNEREKQIVRQRYGLDDKKELKYCEIAENLNVSTERARQLKEKAIMKLQMNTVYGRRLSVRVNEEVRVRFIIKYFENHDIFVDNDEVITEEERKELLKIIEDKENEYSSKIISTQEKNGKILSEKTAQEDALPQVGKNVDDIKPKDEEHVNEENGTKIGDLGLSARVCNALDRARIRTTVDLSNKTLKELSRIRSMGEKSLEELISKMESLGIKPKEEKFKNQEENQVDETDIRNLRLNTRLYNILDRAGIRTVQDLSNTTVDEFSKIRDMGEKTFDELMTKMDSFGIKPKPVTETDEELLRTIQKLSNAYKENKKKGVECQELKQGIFELLDKIDKNNSSVTGSEHESNDGYTNIEK